MSLREQVAKFFAKPIPPVREEANKAAGSQDQRLARDKKAEEERKTASAIDAMQAKLLRTHLTPELTPLGTQPKRPPTGEEARARAENLVAAKDGKDRMRQGDRPAKIEARREAEAKKDTAKEQARVKADKDKDDHLKPDELTPADYEEVLIFQAAHEALGDEQRSSGEVKAPDDYEADLAARVAEIRAAREAEALSDTHTAGGGRTM